MTCIIKSIPQQHFVRSIPKVGLVRLTVTIVVKQAMPLPCGVSGSVYQEGDGDFQGGIHKHDYRAKKNPRLLGG